MSAQYVLERQYISPTNGGTPPSTSTLPSSYQRSLVPEISRLYNRLFLSRRLNPKETPGYII